MVKQYNNQCISPYFCTFHKKTTSINSYFWTKHATMVSSHCILYGSTPQLIPTCAFKESPKDGQNHSCARISARDVTPPASDFSELSKKSAALVLDRIPASHTRPIRVSLWTFTLLEPSVLFTASHQPSASALSFLRVQETLSQSSHHGGHQEEDADAQVGQGECHRPRRAS